MTSRDGFRPHSRRRVRWLGASDRGGWCIKTYHISLTGNAPASGLVDAATGLACDALAAPPGADAAASWRWDDHRTAILIVHEAREAVFVLVSWWVDENMLQHHVWSAPLGDPRQFSYFSPTGVIACVWELAVLAFERDQWLALVLDNPDGPDVPGYHATHLSGDV